MGAYSAPRGVNEPECTGTAFWLEFVQPERRSCSSVIVFENAVPPEILEVWHCYCALLYLSVLTFRKIIEIVATYVIF